jgi:hypothetical protein
MDSKWRRRGPVIALLLLAPIVSEVLYGATRLSFIFVLIPEVGAWGCGALMIRYAARRWRLGWPGMLLMGLALAVAEECVIQQTSIAPLLGIATTEYGRVWGVNWVYFIWALGYEAVWVVLVPVQLVDLIFPSRREEPWLGAGGFIWGAVFFSIASFIAWFSWTKRARVQVYHMPAYDPPLPYIGLALFAIAALIAAAYGRRGPQPLDRRAVPRPAVAGIVTCLLGIPWGALVLLSYAAAPGIPFEWVIAAAVAWAALAFFLMWHWTSSQAWQDAHRFAAVCGAIAACMLSGYVVFAVGGALQVDWIGKAIVNLVAAVWLVTMRRPTAFATTLHR